MVRLTRQGFPAATTPEGRSFVTTDPAPTTVVEPMVTPGHTITPPPSQTSSPIVIGLANSQPEGTLFGVDGVRRGVQVDAGREHHPVADRHAGAIEDDASGAGVEGVADGNERPVITAKSAADFGTGPDRPEEFGEDSRSLRVTRFEGVEVPRQVFGPRPHGDEFRVGGEI